MKTEYEKQVRQAEKQMVELDVQEAELKKRQSQLKVDQLSEAARIRHELDEIQGRRSDLKLLRDIAQEQLEKWQKGMAKAKPLIEDNVTAYERGRQIFVKLAKNQEEARGLLKDLDQVNVILSTNTKQFEDLTGESMGCTLSMQCPVADFFAKAQTIKPYDPWIYRSESELKEEDQRLEAERLKQHEARIKIAEEHAPDCPNCARGNRQTKMIVNRQTDYTGFPGQAGRGNMRHHWALICPKCGAQVTTAIPETKEK